MASSLPTLDDVRSFLRFNSTYTQDDLILSTWFMPAAEEALEHHCGIITPKQYDEFYSGGNVSIWLRHTPVLSVQFLEENHGAINFTLVDQASDSVPASNVWAYSIDKPNLGQITRRTVANTPVPFFPGEDNIHCIFTAGRSDVPQLLGVAYMSLIAIWYREFEQRQVGRASDTFSIEDRDAFTRSSGISSTFMGVPRAIIDMIRPFRRMPVIG